MDEPPFQARSPQEIAAQISETRNGIIRTIDELDAAVAALDNPDPLSGPIDNLRELLTKLWLSQAVLIALLEQQHKD